MVARPAGGVGRRLAKALLRSLAAVGLLLLLVYVVMTFLLLLLLVP